MKSQIIGMQAWLETPPGAYALAWMQQHADAALADVFGYHAVQLGLPGLQALRSNRMPTRWLATLSAAETRDAARLGQAPALCCDSTALPFEPASLDLLVLPLTLDLSMDPHQTLREAERVLMPEGKLLILGMNPASLWGLRQKRAYLYRRWLGVGQPFLPTEGQFIAYWRLRDWLRLLGFEVEASQFGCWRPALRSSEWLARFGWMDACGPRSWPIFGAVYGITAVKRVAGMRVLEPAWKTRPAGAAKALAAVNRAEHTVADGAGRHLYE